MTSFTLIAAHGLAASLELFGEAATYSPADGTASTSIVAAFGAERQDEMGVGDGQMRKMLRQILIARTGASGVADPRFEDVIARGDSLTLEEYEIVDFVERNDAAAVCLCRRKYRNAMTRTGARSTI